VLAHRQEKMHYYSPSSRLTLNVCNDWALRSWILSFWFVC